MAFEILPDEEVVQLAMSDGVGDVVYFQEVAECLATKFAADSCGDAEAMATEVMKMVEEKSRFKPGPDGVMQPTHDDCSVAVAHCGANIPR